MTECTTTPSAEIIEHRGHQIRLTQAGLEWIAAVALPGERPTLIMAPDRAIAINKANDWIDLQLASEGTSE